MSTPAGFEQFFFNTGQPATELTVPPADAAPSDPNSLISALASYGVEVLGPPPSPITAC
ncbi:MAG TPA: hypothetical protein VE673_13865 [Pseudonocardiaceae bacterium]|nr:hypothetical protein [Pseudonocardiaceae bacterium]